MSAADRATFDVWVLAAPMPRARILLCHGYYANRAQVLGIAQGLRERRYETLLMELRGHGERPGPCTLGVKEADDAQQALRWARDRDGAHPLPVGVLGLSMGAVVALQLALREPAVKAVVTDSAYPRFFPVLRETIRRRYHLPSWPFAWVTWWSLQLVLRARLSSLDPATVAPRLRQPLLAIHGGQDPYLTSTRNATWYERWAGVNEPWGDPAVGHVGMFAKDPRAYCDRVAAFFDRVVADAADDRPAH